MTSPDERFDDAYLDRETVVDPFVIMAENWGIRIDTNFAWEPVYCISCGNPVWINKDSTGTIMSYNTDEVLAILADHIRLVHKEVQ